MKVLLCGGITARSVIGTDIGPPVDGLNCTDADRSLGEAGSWVWTVNSPDFPGASVRNAGVTLPCELKSVCTTCHANVPLNPELCDSAKIAFHVPGFGNRTSTCA